MIRSVCVCGCFRERESVCVRERERESFITLLESPLNHLFLSHTAHPLIRPIL